MNKKAYRIITELCFFTTILSALFYAGAGGIWRALLMAVGLIAAAICTVLYLRKLEFSRDENGNFIIKEQNGEELKQLLSSCFETKSDARLWLNTPHPLLGNKTPQELIDIGDTGKVKAMLKDCVMGLPL